MPEFSIRAEHRIKPECRDRWIELARRHSANSLKDPECLRFDVLFSRDDPNLAMLYEVYTNREAWLAHMEEPYLKTFIETIKPLVESRQRWEYERVIGTDRK